MVGWHHQLDGHEFEQALGVGDGQEGLACCSPWGRKESDTTEQLNWTEWPSRFLYFLQSCLSLLLPCPPTYFSVQFSSIQSLSRFRLFETPWTAVLQASLSITNSWSLLKLMSIESVMPSRHLILCRPLLLLPPMPPSIRVFSNGHSSLGWKIQPVE